MKVKYQVCGWHKLPYSQRVGLCMDLTSALPAISQTELLPLALYKHLFLILQINCLVPAPEQ